MENSFKTPYGGRLSSSSVAAATPSSSTSASSEPQPAFVHFVIGNTYRLLSPNEAAYDKLTGRHLKVHDWSLYVDVLPGSDPDIIDRVTFDMRDDSFVTTAFTCHCPIRIRNPTGLIGKQSAETNGNQSTSGQATSEGQPTKENAKIPEPQTSLPILNPGSLVQTCSNTHRWRFSTRQQTYGAVSCEITIRGRGGCRQTIPYEIKLQLGGYEMDMHSLPPFIEKRPYQALKPLKMMDGSFWVQMNYGMDVQTYPSPAGGYMNMNFHDNQISVNRTLSEIAKSVYGRSKSPIRLLLENEYAAMDSKEKSCRTEELGFNKPTSSSIAWTLRGGNQKQYFSNDQHNFAYKNDFGHPPTQQFQSGTFSISSPVLTGGHGLNECYKIIQGLPPKIVLSDDDSASASFSRNTRFHGGLIVQIDVSTLTLPQLIKLCQNFVKYEEAIDSFFPWGKREDRCEDCRSNKSALRSAKTNKQRNMMISKCTTIEELVMLMCPVQSLHYKMNLRMLLEQTGPKIVEFRQHTSSKDKTAVTHWIRFCMAFVRNSARLRAPLALKATTSIEDELDMMFEFIIKDRALRNYFRQQRDRIVDGEERAIGQQAVEDNMTYNSSDLVGKNGELNLAFSPTRPRVDEEDMLPRKRRYL